MTFSRDMRWNFQHIGAVIVMTSTPKGAMMILTFSSCHFFVVSMIYFFSIIIEHLPGNVVIFFLKS